MRVALYARVSTDRQETENQLRELRDFCSKRGDVVIAEYIDEDVSGRLARKPRLEDLLRDAHRRAFDLVAFTSFDRLTRRGPDDAADILARIEATGCDFVSYREPSLNTMGPWKRVLIDALAIVANFEAQRIRERTKAGIATARAQGKRLGRPRVDTQGITGTDIARLRAQGLSWAEVAIATKLSTGTARRLAKIVSAESG